MPLAGQPAAEQVFGGAERLVRPPEAVERRGNGPRHAFFSLFQRVETRRKAVMQPSLQAVSLQPLLHSRFSPAVGVSDLPGPRVEVVEDPPAAGRVRHRRVQPGVGEHRVDQAAAIAARLSFPMRGINHEVCKTEVIKKMFNNKRSRQQAAPRGGTKEMISPV